MKHRSRILVVLLLAVAAAAVAYVSLRRDRDSGEGVISFSGNIELTEARIAFKVAGRLAELDVREGDSVRKDSVIARLDQEQLLRQVDRARAALAQVESQLQQTRTAVDFQRENYRGQVEQRQAEVSVAQARLRDLEAGPRIQEVEHARAAVARARSENETVAADWERAQGLYRDEDISRSQYDQARNRREAATAGLRQAEEQLALVLAGPRKDQVEGARADLTRAEAALRLAESQRLEVTRREQEVVGRQAEVDRARADVAVAESLLRDTVATAPADGVILVKTAEEGEVLAPGAGIVTLGDIDHPWMRGYVGELELGRVKLGDRVRVSSDSYPGKDYWGTISYIASEAEFTPKQIQTPEERVKLVYRVKVDIANPEHELKSNMPVDAEIVP